MTRALGGRKGSKLRRYFRRLSAAVDRIADPNRRLARWLGLVGAVIGVVLGTAGLVALVGALFKGSDGPEGSMQLVGDRLTVGDYDKDGRADVAMGYDVGDGRFRIYRWSSTGSRFTDLSKSDPVQLEAPAGRMASGDFDGDRRDDIVMATQNRDGTFSYHVWLAGSSYDDTWYTSPTFDLGRVGDRLTVGYYDGDKKADVAMAYSMDDGSMSMHLWVSTGSAFTELQTNPSDVSPSRVGDRMASGDFNEDGRDDIVMAHQNADFTFSYHVWSAGSSYLGTWYTSDRPPATFNQNLVDDRLIAGNYAGDGKADVALSYDVGNGRMRIYRWTSTGSDFRDLVYPEYHGFDVANVLGRVGSGDVNADGKDDIVMAYQNADGTFSFRVWNPVETSSLGTWYASDP